MQREIPCPYLGASISVRVDRDGTVHVSGDAPWWYKESLAISFENGVIRIEGVAGVRADRWFHPGVILQSGNKRFLSLSQERGAAVFSLSGETVVGEKLPGVALADISFGDFAKPILRCGGRITGLDVCGEAFKTIPAFLDEYFTTTEAWRDRFELSNVRFRPECDSEAGDIRVDGLEKVVSALRYTRESRIDIVSSESIRSYPGDPGVRYSADNVAVDDSGAPLLPLFDALVANETIYLEWGSLSSNLVAHAQDRIRKLGYAGRLAFRCESMSYRDGKLRIFPGYSDGYRCGSLSTGIKLAALSSAGESIEAIEYLPEPSSFYDTAIQNDALIFAHIITRGAVPIENVGGGMVFRKASDRIYIEDKERVMPSSNLNVPSVEDVFDAFSLQPMREVTLRNGYGYSTSILSWVIEWAVFPFLSDFRGRERKPITIDISRVYNKATSYPFRPGDLHNVTVLGVPNIAAARYFVGLGAVKAGLLENNRIVADWPSDTLVRDWYDDRLDAFVAGYIHATPGNILYEETTDAYLDILWPEATVSFSSTRYDMLAPRMEGLVGREVASATVEAIATIAHGGPDIVGCGHVVFPDRQKVRDGMAMARKTSPSNVYDFFVEDRKVVYRPKGGTALLPMDGSYYHEMAEKFAKVLQAILDRFVPDGCEGAMDTLLECPEWLSLSGKHPLYSERTVESRIEEETERSYTSSRLGRLTWDVNAFDPHLWASDVHFDDASIEIIETQGHIHGNMVGDLVQIYDDTGEVRERSNTCDQVPMPQEKRGGDRVEYTVSKDGDTIIVEYTAYDADGNDVTDTYRTFTIGDMFLHRDFDNGGS